VSLRGRFDEAELDWIVPAWAAPANVVAFATTRNGGAGTGDGATLDLGPSRLDALEPVKRESILANRARVQAFLPTAPVLAEQVHGRDVVTVDGTNVAALRERPPVADALVTRLPGMPLAVRVADCLPVLFASLDGRVVGAAHAGWRGLAAGVLEATVAAMRVPGSELCAWLGPAIGPQAFEVGDDVRDAFTAQDEAALAHFAPHGAGKWLADLPSLARQRLAAAGVTRVAECGACTFSDAARFHSWRRDRSPARMAACIWLAA
jgi:YfiH family protein